VSYLLVTSFFFFDLNVSALSLFATTWFCRLSSFLLYGLREAQKRLSLLLQSVLFFSPNSLSSLLMTSIFFSPFLSLPFFCGPLLVSGFHHNFAGLGSFLSLSFSPTSPPLRPPFRFASRPIGLTCLSRPTSLCFLATPCVRAPFCPFFLPPILCFLRDKVVRTSPLPPPPFSRRFETSISGIPISPRCRIPSLSSRGAP